jgi:hypothetical protein
MNRNTVSPECADRCCGSCTYQDCACRCHIAEHFDTVDYAGELEDDDEIRD